MNKNISKKTAKAIALTDLIKHIQNNPNLSMKQKQQKIQYLIDYYIRDPLKT